MKKLIQVRNIYSIIGVSFVFFLSSQAFAANIMDVSNENIGLLSDTHPRMLMMYLNWLIFSVGAAFAALLGYLALKHIKHREYRFGFSDLTYSFLAGGITYFVYMYFLK